MANNPPVLVDALLAIIASLRDSLVAANVHAAKMERDTHKDRASIVAFLTAETKRIDDAAERVDDEDHGVTGKRLRAQASIGRTWTAQIERGDDRNGADTALVKPAITGRLVTVGQITTCDNDCADSGDYNFTTMSGALIVMDDDSVRAAAGLFGKVIEIRGVG